MNCNFTFSKYSTSLLRSLVVIHTFLRFGALVVVKLVNLWASDGLKDAVNTQPLCYGYNFCTLPLMSCVWPPLDSSTPSLIFITELSVIQIFSLHFKNIGRLCIWVRWRPGKPIFLTILLETRYRMIIIHRLCFNNLLQDLEDICPLQIILLDYKTLNRV